MSDNLPLPAFEDAVKALRPNPHFQSVLQAMRGQFAESLALFGASGGDEAIVRRGELALLASMYESFAGQPIVGSVPSVSEDQQDKGY